MRPHNLALFSLLFAGCSSGGAPLHPLPAKPTAAAFQGAPDLTEQPDLGAPADLAQRLDLAELVDLDAALDLGSPPDLAEPPDLASPPRDMASPPAGCFVVLKPPVALPVSLGPGVYRYELGEIPRPELGVDVTLQFVRSDRLFTKYIVTISDDSCSTKCPSWVHEWSGAGKYTYRFHDTAGWRRPVLTVEVAGVGTTVDLQAAELMAACR